MPFLRIQEVFYFHVSTVCYSHSLYWMGFWGWSFRHKYKLSRLSWDLVFLITTQKLKLTLENALLCKTTPRYENTSPRMKFFNTSFNKKRISPSQINLGAWCPKSNGRETRVRPPPTTPSLPHSSVHWTEWTGQPPTRICESNFIPRLTDYNVQGVCKPHSLLSLPW